MALSENEIKVIIAAELQKAGFVKAERATKNLTNSFKKLGATIGVALSARAFVNFAKQGAVAFAAEEKAVKQLTTSLANLGFAFSVPAVERYIDNVEKATMISKEELRPAMVQLISTTMSANKSMELLGTALDIAAETGASVSQVTTALSRAYNGNYTSIAKLSRGYTSAQLEAAGFDMTVQMLNDRFQGSAASATDTYSFKIAQLKKAVSDAQKEIGSGLIKGLEQLGSGDYNEGLQDLVDFGNAIGKSFGYAAGAVNTLKQAYDFITLRPVRDITSEILGKQRDEKRGGTKSPTQFELVQTSIQKRKEKALRDAEKRDREKLLKLSQQEAKARETAIKNEQALKRAGTVFDMENIQIVAALQGKIDGEQRLRLTALLAINTQNAEAAEKLSKAVLALNSAAFQSLGVTMNAADNVDTLIGKILVAQAKVALINLDIADLPKAKNPFDEWPDILTQILGQIAAIKAGLNFKATFDVQKPPPVTPPTVQDPPKRGFIKVGGAWINPKTTFSPEDSPGYQDPNAVTETPQWIKDLFQGVDYRDTNDIPPTVNNITVNGALDPVSTARTISELLNQEATTSGSFTTLGASKAFGTP